MFCIFIIAFNIYFTGPLIAAHQNLSTYSNKDALFLTTAVYNSYLWARELYLMNFQNISIATLMSEYTLVSDIEEKIYFYTNQLREYVYNLREIQKESGNSDFFYSYACLNNEFCEDYFLNGLNGALMDYALDIENSIYDEMDFNKLLIIENKMKNIVNGVEYFKENTYAYLYNEENKLSLVQPAIILCVVMFILFYCFYKVLFGSIWQKTIMYSKIKKFFSTYCSNEQDECKKK